MSDEEGVSDSEGERYDAWELQDEQRWAGPGYHVTRNDDASEHPYTYTPIDGGAPTHQRPDMHPDYKETPRPGVTDEPLPAFPPSQAPADDEVDPYCGLLTPDEFGHANVAKDYCHAITMYGLYEHEGAAALIMHFQKKVTSVEALVYAERDSVKSDPAWRQERQLIKGPRSDNTFLDDGVCEMDDFRCDGTRYDETYGGWGAKVPADGTASDGYAACCRSVLEMKTRTPPELLAMTADFHEAVQMERDAYVEAVTARQWQKAANMRAQMGLDAAARICDEMTDDTTVQASPWYKEKEQVQGANHPDERYIRALRLGKTSVAQARQALSSRPDKRKQAAIAICQAQMGLAEDDDDWIARIEAELEQLHGGKKRGPPAPAAGVKKKKRASAGGGAMACIVGSRRAVEKDVQRRRPAPTTRQIPERGMVPYRTDAVCSNPVGDRECVLEAVRFALGTNRLSRKDLGLGGSGDLILRQLVHAINYSGRYPMTLRKSEPCRWSALLTKPPGIYVFRVLLKDGEAHYMAIDTWRMLLFVGGASRAETIDPYEQYLYLDGRRPEDHDTGIGRTFFIEDDEVADPDKFEAWVTKTIEVASSGVDNVYGVYLNVKHARDTCYNTPEHFDQ